MSVNASSLNSYLINMLYSGGGVNRSTRNTFTGVNNLSSLRIYSNAAAKDFKAQQAGYKNQIAGFNSAATDLKTRAQEFTSKNNVLDKKYIADDNNAITGEATGTAKSAVYDVSVQKLAISQRNDGKSLNADGFGGVGNGLYSFGITIGTGQEKQLTVNISSTDSNKQALNKIADAVNRSDCGVKAEVKQANTTAYLSIEGQNTGGASGFTLRDISNNLVANLNLSNKVQNAQDAVYTVNGENKQSAANQVKLDNGNVNLTLNAVTTGTDKVTVGVNYDKTVSAVRDLLASYNEINYNFRTADNITKRGDRLLTNIRNQFSGVRRDEFQNIGITMDRQTGNISLDTDKLAKALQSNPNNVERLLSGSTGLAKAAEKAAKTALNVPAATYFKAPNFRDHLNYNFLGGNTNNFYNYSQGLFLDTMV